MKKEIIKNIFCGLLIGLFFIGFAFLLDEYAPKKEKKIGILKSKNIETHITYTSYYFMYDNGYIDCVDIQKYMSYEVGDKVYY